MAFLSLGLTEEVAVRVDGVLPFSGGDKVTFFRDLRTNATVRTNRG